MVAADEDGARLLHGSEHVDQRSTQRLFQHLVATVLVRGEQGRPRLRLRTEKAIAARTGAAATDTADWFRRRPDAGVERWTGGGRVRRVSEVRMLYATPANGWQFSVESRGLEEVEVEFVRGDAEVRVRAECDGGAVEADVDDD